MNPLFGAADIDDRAPDTLARVRSDRVGRDEGSAVGPDRLLNSIDGPAVMLDGSGRIIAANEGWAAALAEGDGEVDLAGVGVNYLTVCDRAAGPFVEGAAEAAAGIRAVLGGQTDRFAMDYACPSPSKQRWFSLRVNAVGPIGGGAVVTHHEITDLKVAEQRLRHGGSELGSLLADSAPIFALVGGDGVIRHSSPSTARILGLEPNSAVGGSAFARIDAADQDMAHAVFDRVVSSPGTSESALVHCLGGDGRRVELDLTITNLLADPIVAALVITGADVTESRRTQIARRLEARLLQRLPAAVVVTDDQGVVVYWNDRAEEVYGYPAAAALGRPVLELDIRARDAEVNRQVFDAVATHGRWEGDYDARRANGSAAPIHATFERVDDEEIGFHGVVSAASDISDRRELEQNLAFQALHDSLTGLPNRRLFVSHLEHSLSRCERTGRHLAVLFVDVDDFRLVNERSGADIGDEILRSAGDLITGALRVGDVAARLGGDEFAVCCDDLSSPDEAYAVAERIMAMLKVPFRTSALSIEISVSVGIAFSGPGSRPTGLLRNADAAIWAAKDAGKGRISVFDDAVRDEVRRQRIQARELEAALDAGEIHTFFQPEISLRTGEILGFEALARWETTDGQRVPPAEFIPVAESSGLIGRLGEVVLEEACRRLAHWTALQPDRGLRIAINISTYQLMDPEFPARVREILDRFDLPAAKVCLELTESAVVDADAATTALRRLKAIGVELAIDDFGTGYSSLSRLHEFPLDYLKIDRSFVGTMTTRAEGAVIAEAVVNLARALGLRTIAEGIERPDQLEHLRAMGCDAGQGYLWSAAVSADAVLELIDMPESLSR